MILLPYLEKFTPRGSITVTKSRNLAYYNEADSPLNQSEIDQLKVNRLIDLSTLSSHPVFYICNRNLLLRMEIII